MESVESVESVGRRQPEETVRPLGNRTYGDGWVGVNAQTMRGGFGRGQQAEGKHGAGYETAHRLCVGNSRLYGSWRTHSCVPRRDSSRRLSSAPGWRKHVDTCDEAS